MSKKIYVVRETWYTNGEKPCLIRSKMVKAYATESNAESSIAVWAKEKGAHEIPVRTFTVNDVNPVTGSNIIIARNYASVELEEG